LSDGRGRRLPAGTATRPSWPRRKAAVGKLPTAQAGWKSALPNVVGQTSCLPRQAGSLPHAGTTRPTAEQTAPQPSPQRGRQNVARGGLPDVASAKSGSPGDTTPPQIPSPGRGDRRVRCVAPSPAFQPGLPPRQPAPPLSYQLKNHTFQGVCGTRRGFPP